MSPRGRSPHFPHCVPSKWSQVPCSLEKPGQPQAHPTLPTAANIQPQERESFSLCS